MEVKKESIKNEDIVKMAMLSSFISDDLQEVLIKWYKHIEDRNLIELPILMNAILNALSTCLLSSLKNILNENTPEASIKSLLNEFNKNCVSLVYKEFFPKKETH